MKWVKKIKQLIDLCGNAVKVSASLNGQLATALRALLYQLDLLQGLQGFASDAASWVAEVWGTDTIPFTPCNKNTQLKYFVYCVIVS